MAVAPVVSRFVFLKKGEGCSIVAGSNWTRESKVQSSFIERRKQNSEAYSLSNITLCLCLILQPGLLLESVTRLIACS